MSGTGLQRKPPAEEDILGYELISTLNLCLSIFSYLGVGSKVPEALTYTSQATPHQEPLSKGLEKWQAEPQGSSPDSFYMSLLGCAILVLKERGAEVLHIYVCFR